jgi:flagellar basal body-associated protein FliL
MRRKLPRILLAICLLAGAGVGAFFANKSRVFYQDVVVKAAAEALEQERKASTTEHNTPLFSLDEIFANIAPSVMEKRSGKPHAIDVKLEVELFSEESRPLMEQRQGGVKNTIIESAMVQQYDDLSTVAGKLYFMELLVAKMNEFFHQAVVRDLHFSSFYLR